MGQPQGRPSSRRRSGRRGNRGGSRGPQTRRSTSRPTQSPGAGPRYPETLVPEGGDKIPRRPSAPWRYPRWPSKPGGANSELARHADGGRNPTSQGGGGPDAEESRGEYVNKKDKAQTNQPAPSKQAEVSASDQFDMLFGGGDGGAGIPGGQKFEESKDQGEGDANQLMDMLGLDDDGGNNEPAAMDDAIVIEEDAAIIVDDDN